MSITGIVVAIVYYNSLEDALTNWVKQRIVYGCIIRPPFYGLSGDEDEYDKKQVQLQILWAIAVLMFGDFSVDPSHGRITKADDFKSWCEDIIKSVKQWRGALNENL